MIKTIKELLEIAKKKKKKTLVVASAEDEYVISAVEVARKMNIINPILIGDKEKIESIIKDLAYDINDYKIINTDSVELSAKKAVELIRNHEADILMKGLLDTKVILKEVVNKETGIKKAKLLSHVALLEYPNLNRVLFSTDGAMVVNPTVEQKIEIIKNAVSLLHSLDYKNPKVGLVSSVEKVNPAINSSIEASEVVQLLNQENNLDFIVDGPFAIDNLVSEEAAKHKSITSVVAGNADILVHPNIDAGNIFYKTSIFLGNATPAGIIIGATNPIVLTSRADSSEAKVASIALSVVYHEHLF